MTLCVLIPCYNNFSGLVKSLNSIRYEKDLFFVLVVDDGSDSAFTAEDISRELCNPLTIKVVRKDKNGGIAAALNWGLKHIYSHTAVKYIARLDCGDICTNTRFYKQVNFLENNINTHLVGSWCYFEESATGVAYSYKTPVNHERIIRKMYFKNVFIHPTVMWRVSGTGKVFYPENFPCAEDYALFYEIISRAASAVIPEYLVTCEINTGGISISKRNSQLKSRLKIISYYNKNKFWLFCGTIKLYVLILTPHSIIYFIKKNIFKAT